jgi:hypothetical protein
MTTTVTAPHLAELRRYLGEIRDPLAHVPLDYYVGRISTSSDNAQRRTTSSD